MLMSLQRSLPRLSVKQPHISTLKLKQFFNSFSLCRLCGKSYNYNTSSNSNSNASSRSSLSSFDFVDDPKFRKYVDNIIQEHQYLERESINNILSVKSRNRLLAITRSVKLCEQLNSIENDLSELAAMMGAEQDSSMKELWGKEQKEVLETKERLCLSIVDSLSPIKSDDISEVILEVHSGVGGLEAAIFASELSLMYEKFSRYKGWSWRACEVQSMEGSVGDGTKSVKINPVNMMQVELCGQDVYKLLKFESGIHRVQRVPSTDKYGRVHTSTAVVVVLPKPQNVEIHISATDLKLDVFRSRGGGGQSVNTTQSAVRLTHIPTGTVVECQQDRSQITNKRIAMKNLESRLYEKQLSDQQAKTNSMRRLQIGGANRNEKIRTYNYAQNRITDHRVKQTVVGVTSFLNGDVIFDEFVKALISEDQKERLKQWIDELPLQDHEV